MARRVVVPLDGGVPDLKAVREDETLAACETTLGPQAACETTLGPQATLGRTANAHPVPLELHKQKERARQLVRESAEAIRAHLALDAQAIASKLENLLQSSSQLLEQQLALLDENEDLRQHLRLAGIQVEEIPRGGPAGSPAMHSKESKESASSEAPVDWRVGTLNSGAGSPVSREVGTLCGGEGAQANSGHAQVATSSFGVSAQTLPQALGQSQTLPQALGQSPAERYSTSSEREGQDSKRVVSFMEGGEEMICEKSSSTLDRSPLTGKSHVQQKGKVTSIDEEQQDVGGDSRNIRITDGGDSRNITESREATGSKAMPVGGTVSVASHWVRSASEFLGPQQRLSTQQVRQLTIGELFQENPRQFVRMLVHGWAFDVMSGAVVLASTFFIGYEANYIAVNGGTQRDIHNSVHLAFNVFFLLELCIRMLVDGPSFFCNRHWRWNWLDITLVATSVLDLLLSQASNSEFSAATGRQFRVIRILRLLRTVRLFRTLRSIHEFRKMLYAIICSIRTLMCALLMLFFVMYFFAVLICSGVADFRSHVPEEEQHSNLQVMYGTLFQTIYTLFSAVSNGNAWVDVITPLEDLDFMYPAAAVVYIALVLFGVSNVVTSVFVESAVRTAQHYRDLIVDETKQMKDIALCHIKEVFKVMDTDCSGSLCMTELERVMTDPELKCYLDALEINGEDSRMFFRLLDADGSGKVDLQEFIDGCLRLQGEAKCIDVHALIHSAKVSISRFSKFAEFVEEKFFILASMTGADMSEWHRSEMSANVRNLSYRCSAAVFTDPIDRLEPANSQAAASDSASTPWWR